MDVRITHIVIRKVHGPANEACTGKTVPLIIHCITQVYHYTISQTRRVFFPSF